MTEIEKHCPSCNTTKSAEYFSVRRKGSYPHLQNFCKLCVKKKLKSTRTLNARENIRKTLEALTQAAVPLSMLELEHKTGLAKVKLRYIMEKIRTKHLFIAHRPSRRKTTYSLSSDGHCATEKNNYLINTSPELIVEREISSVLMDFFKLTQARCAAWAC